MKRILRETFYCDCCGEEFPLSKRKILGRDELCEDCFWSVKRDFKKYSSLF